MANQVANQHQLTTKSLFQKESIQKRFEALLGKKAPGFISSVLQIVNGNQLLSKADPQTVLNAAATAASLDLPINQNLGFSYIVPYKGQAQFQMGWKGYVQLALRTGQYQNINVTEVYENQFKGFNRMTEELDADFSVDGEGPVVGYVGYFRLLNGFEKTSYWSKEQVQKHAMKYSQTYGKKNRSGNLIHSPWNDADQFDEMAKKTVLKNMISKWGIMSLDMQTAQLADQATQESEGNYTYPDNETLDIESEEMSEEAQRALEFISKAQSIEDLEMIEEGYPDMDEEVRSALVQRKDELKNANAKAS